MAIMLIDKIAKEKEMKNLLNELRRERQRALKPVVRKDAEPAIKFPEQNLTDHNPFKNQPLTDSKQHKKRQEYRSHRDHREHVIWNKLQDVQKYVRNTVPKYRENRDIPMTTGLFDKGCAVSGLGYLETFANRMDRAHFTELCVVNNGVLRRLELKVTQDKPYWLQPENIIARLKCTIAEAIRFSNAWEKLRLKDNSIKKLMFGYEDEQYEMTAGIEKTGNKWLAYFESLAETMQPFEDEENNQYGFGYSEDTEYTGEPEEFSIEEQVSETEVVRCQEIIAKITPEHATSFIDEVEGFSDWLQEQPDDLIDYYFKEKLKPDMNFYTAKELCNTERDEISNNWIRVISEADRKLLTRIKAYFMKTYFTYDGQYENEYGQLKTKWKDTKKKKVKDVLSDKQITEAWKWIKIREQKLIDSIDDDIKYIQENGLSDEVKETIEFYEEHKDYSPKQANFRLTRQIYGGSFTYQGETLYLNPPENEHEINVLWAIKKGQI